MPLPLPRRHVFVHMLLFGIPYAFFSFPSAAACKCSTRRIFAMLTQKCPLLYLSCFSHGPQGLSSIPISCEVVLALASSGHVAATKVAAEEWPQLGLLVGSCWRCAFLVDDIYTRLYAFKNRTCVHQRFNMFCIYPCKYKGLHASSLVCCCVELVARIVAFLQTQHTGSR